jgi:hypothetical protein
MGMEHRAENLEQEQEHEHEHEHRAWSIEHGAGDVLSAATATVDPALSTLSQSAKASRGSMQHMKKALDGSDQNYP